MTIDERLKRLSVDDKIYFGDLVEAASKTEIWKLLEALTAGRRSAQIKSADIDRSLSADRVLGRLEAYETLLDDLEQFVVDRDDLQKPLQKTVSEEQYSPEENYASEAGVGIVN